MELIWHDEARREFIDSVVYYGLIDHELGERYLRSLERALAVIQVDPDRYRVIESGARRVRIDSFPYAVVYLNDVDKIHVVAVMHLHRRPGYWMERIR
jgi:plasmid stabilization system protein ParE